MLIAICEKENSTITRTKDDTTIKQNEDNKSAFNQMNLHQVKGKELEQKTKQVNESDNVNWHKKSFDAKDKGNGSYSGDGGKNRKNNPQNKKTEQMIVKGQEGFDIRI